MSSTYDIRGEKVNYYMFPNTMLMEDNPLKVSYKPQSVYDTMWRISNNDSITIPYRVEGIRAEDSYLSQLIADDKMAHLCYLTRNQNGFIRFNALDEILNLTDKQKWVYPYVLKLCDEYVVEILERIYCSLSKILTPQFVDVIRLNMSNLKKGYARMVSYWNAYYRKDIPNIENYVGYKIYKTLIDAKTQP